MQWHMQHDDLKQADAEHKCCACLHTSNEASTIHIDGLGMQLCPRYQFYCAECVCRSAKPLKNPTIWNAALGKRVPVFEADGQTLARTWVPPVRAVERAQTKVSKPAEWLVTAQQTIAQIKQAVDQAGDQPKWPVCATCTFENAPGMVRCEMCGTAAPRHTWPDLAADAAQKLATMGFGASAARAAAAAIMTVLREEHGASSGDTVAHEELDALVDTIVKRSVERLLGSGIARPWAPRVPISSGPRGSTVRPAPGVRATAGARGKTKGRSISASGAAAAATAAASAAAARRATRPGLNREDLGPSIASAARGATAATKDATSMLKSLQQPAEVDAWAWHGWAAEEEQPPRSSVRGERIAPCTTVCCDACGEVDVWLVRDATPGRGGGVYEYCDVCWDDFERSEAAEMEVAAFLGEQAKRDAVPTVLEAAAAAAKLDAAAMVEATEVAVAAEAAEAAAEAAAADGGDDDDDDDDDEDWVALDAEAESDVPAVAGAEWEHAVVDLSMLGSAPAAPLSEPRGGAEVAGLARHRQRMGVRSMPVYATRPAQGLGGEGEGGADWEVLSVAGSEACTEFSQCTEHTEAFSEAHTEAWEDEYAAVETSPPSAAASPALESVDEGEACTSWAERVRTLGAAPATAGRPVRAAQIACRRQRTQSQPQPRRGPKMVVAPKRGHLPRWSEVAFVTH